MNIENIWFYETKDGSHGGFIIVEIEEIAWFKLSVIKYCTIEEIKNKFNFYPINSLDLNRDVHELW